MTERYSELNSLYVLLMLVAWPAVVTSYALTASLTMSNPWAAAIFWFLLGGLAIMVTYHPVIQLLEFLTPANQLAPTPNDTQPAQVQSRIAILYTVCDDFEPLAFKSCIEAAREVGGQILVLDDSSQVPVSERIESMLQDGDPVRVVRRVHRRAFKAGNINHAIKTQRLRNHYDYIILADADEILVPGASTTLAATLDANPHAAFVQLAHASRDDALSWFARIMRVMTDVRYRYYRRYTNQYGLPLSHGHGVAIRLALLEHGLPELISEDIAMSIGLRQAGYRGLFLKEPLCQEATADDLTAFCRRERRCMAADIECLITKALPMITARGVRLVEKWDLLIRQLRYPVKLFFTFSIAFAVISSVSGWATCCRLGLASPVAKSVWLLAALIPWAAYFRFFGFRRVLAALDFLLVSLPTHISCMILHLEGTALGLWLAIKGEQYLPCLSGVDRSAIGKLWVPANAKVRYAPSILGDWLRYLLPGLTIATVGAIWLRWELISIGISPIAVWMATRKPLDEKVGALVVRSAGFIVMLTLLMYMVLPSSDCVSDLVVLSLAVILF